MGGKAKFVWLDNEDYFPPAKQGGTWKSDDIAADAITLAKLVDFTGQGYIIRGGASGAPEEYDASTSGQILVGDGTDIASVAVSGDVTLSSAGAFTIANDAVNEAKTADSSSTGGLYVRKFATATYDFSVDGGTEGTITLASTATIPDNAVVTAINYDVITTCTSSGDAATIKLNLPTDGDISTAIAISDGTNPWDAGAHLASVITPIAVKTTGARAVQIITAGGQDLTAGKIVFGIEYFVTE